MRLSFILLCLFVPAILSAQTQFSLQPGQSGQAAPQALLGSWGSAEQCAAYRAGEGDQPGKSPYRIAAEWIRQGNIYCYLDWSGSESRDGALFAYARVQCGEDDLREYRLLLQLSEAALRIRWSDDYTTPELRRCSE